MNSKVSVVIPCYNLEKEIIPCVDSVCGQTYRNLEIIVVNDGSTDRSQKLLEDKQKEEPRLIVISQENAGVSHARNVGIRHASGEYLMFVDGDDTIGKSYIEDFMKAVEPETDFVIGGFRYVYGDGSVSDIPGTEFCCDRSVFIKNYYTDFVGKRLIFGPINKIYRTGILQEKEVVFDEALEIREDGIFVLDYLEHARHIAGVKNSEYFYMQHDHSGSLVMKFHEDEYEINEMYFHRLLDVLGKENLSPRDIAVIYPIFLNMEIGSIRKLYLSNQYDKQKAAAYISRILTDETFRKARETLLGADKKRARKYYRPEFMVRLINERARRKRRK